MFELKTPAPAELLRLQCLRGAAPPPALAGDVQALVALPEALRQRFWAILEPCLDRDPEGDEQAAIVSLCEAHDVDPAALLEPLRGARFLVHAAARAALTREAFAEDVERLARPGEFRHALGALLPCFEQAMPRLRQRIVARTIADHGKLVEDVSWRVDKIINSEHGDGVNVAVAVLSFRYREGERSERITLHLLPEQLQKLKDACLSILP